MPWQPPYVTLAELKSYLRISDLTDDAELDLIRETASRAIDQATNRQFGQVDVAEERFYTACFDTRRRRWVVQIEDVQDTTGLLIDLDNANDGTFSTNLPAAEVQLHPFNSAEKDEPFERFIVRHDASAFPVRGEGLVRVTALFGWSAIPDTIKAATLLQANRFNERRNAPFGVAGSPDTGSEVRLLARADPDVKVMVKHFTRHWGAV